MSLAPEKKQHTIKVWSFQDVLLELYRYAPGPAESLPKHSHAEYQFCLSLDFPGEYYYRGTYYAVPVSSLSIIHPGEVHSARDVEDRQNCATFRTLYASVALLETIAAEIAGHQTSLPFFANPIILDRSLARLFLDFHLAVETSTSKLEQESLLLHVLTQLTTQYADAKASERSVGREQNCVRQAREYLEDNLAQNVSLEQLAQVVNLSPYHLHRVFCSEIGLPPHQYQTQVRIARAKRLLSQGLSIRQVSIETGFADQSHFTRHFKRLMQVTPGRYRSQNGKSE
ncbi:AraC family transcriptional regulator [Leptolyngbya sp. FACHB-261]|uniref:AraC family transcriptional regulator n=1 Tax=Leptolyngbya sp. FACHB-261 TaxID=2692806 RepID=UPI0016880C72|nr:AraC family transcriptional regulator [Leptolyngbya sp. FACHB-261]MBD2103519.1 helix-turn-helix transcriptional regulator [Leptolyngbya sp. FACHB-261]